MPNISDREPAEKVMQQIHDLVSEELMISITETIKAHVAKNGDVEIRVVCSTLSYMLGDAIAQGLTHKEICSVSESYATYIHNLAHACREEDHPDSGIQEDTGAGLLAVIFKNKRPN